MKVEPGSVGTNFRSWNYEEGKYPMQKEEADALLVMCERDRMKKPKTTADGFSCCPICQRIIDKTDKFCRECGQRVGV